MVRLVLTSIGAGVVCGVLGYFISDKIKVNINKFVEEHKVTENSEKTKA